LDLQQLDGVSRLIIDKPEKRLDRNKVRIGESGRGPILMDIVKAGKAPARVEQR
jgi:hypothetical protein